MLPASFNKLVNQLERLPGVGTKSAQRIAFYLLNQPPEQAKNIGRDIENLSARVKNCAICGMLTEENRCAICRNPERKHEIICVIEGPLDLIAIERTNKYEGVYHVLGGVLSPLNNIGPEDLNIPALIEQVHRKKPEEIILALNPSTEGETTTLYLKKLLSKENVALSRLAQGLPTGAALEFADDLTISHAFTGRQKF